MDANHTASRLCLLSSHAGYCTVVAEITFEVCAPGLLRVFVHVMVSNDDLQGWGLSMLDNLGVLCCKTCRILGTVSRFFDYGSIIFLKMGSCLQKGSKRSVWE